MRYLILKYYLKPNGQTDEAMAVTKTLRNSDITEASIILDFKLLKVVKASMSGNTIPKDWDTIVGYYYQHYKSTIERLFKENGYEVVESAPEITETDSTMEENQSE